ncbi:MAG: hypothetical protein KC561_05100 [Myxococcales bacterium]|nr:hypothetical protein [Myxococcales bacterium]
MAGDRNPVWQTFLRALLWLGPICIALLTYRGALNAGYVFDDHLFWGLDCWQI